MELRKPPKLWQIIQPNELQDFLSADKKKGFNHLEEEEKFCFNSSELKKKPKVIF